MSVGAQTRAHPVDSIEWWGPLPPQPLKPVPPPPPTCEIHAGSHKVYAAPTCDPAVFVTAYLTPSGDAVFVCQVLHFSYSLRWVSNFGRERFKEKFWTKSGIWMSQFLAQKSSQLTFYLFSWTKDKLPKFTVKPFTLKINKSMLWPALLAILFKLWAIFVLQQCLLSYQRRSTCLLIDRTPVI